MVPTKPAFTVIGKFSEFSASAFSVRSLRTTSPVDKEKRRIINKLEWNQFYYFSHNT